MRNVVCFIILVFTTNLFGQVAPDYRSNWRYQFTKEEYLQKSKREFKTAKILFFAGVPTAVIGGVGFSKAYEDGSEGSTDFFGFMFLGGLVSTVVSLPFFIVASSHEDKAAELSLGSQKLLMPRQDSFAAQAVPSLILKVKF